MENITGSETKQELKAKKLLYYRDEKQKYFCRDEKEKSWWKTYLSPPRIIY